MTFSYFPWQLWLPRPHLSGTSHRGAQRERDLGGVMTMGGKKETPTLPGLCGTSWVLCPDVWRLMLQQRSDHSSWFLCSISVRSSDETSATCGRKYSGCRALLCHMVAGWDQFSFYIVCKVKVWRYVVLVSSNLGIFILFFTSTCSKFDC